MKILTPSEAFEDHLKKDPLRDFFLWWDDVSKDDLEKLEACIDNASCEEDVQKFLSENPKSLIQHLTGGHGRWVIPKQKLGSEFVTDFMIAEKNSYGFTWYAVELESPKSHMFNKSGDPSKYLVHAIRQIQDWRAWLLSNQNYAARLRTENGLGLTEINPNLRGIIVIDRAANIEESTNARRRQMINDLNIDIHSFDYLAASLRAKLPRLQRDAT